MFYLGGRYVIIIIGEVTRARRVIYVRFLGRLGGLCVFIGDFGFV